ncbi:ATP-binding protein [Embleya scabrispora]|uniref:ATP-binding protein n=1 Tax=Embleya scabrispora TaxID=159449 RepID=UPI00036E2EDC|nr:ATP-binding protein [Embleya scabrispora]MYS86354.1 ATP-binding protein [Streptomyces sp. SID5474]
MTVLNDAHPVCRFDLPPHEAEVSAARRKVVAIAVEWGMPAHGDLVDTLRLVVSELVTNAIRHAGVLTPAIGVTVCGTDDGGVQVGVHDRHPFCPKALLETVDDDSGRGLLIVKALVAEAGGYAGIQPDTAGGKTVWVTLPLR